MNMDTGIYPQCDRFDFNYDNGEARTAINRLMLTIKLNLKVFMFILAPIWCRQIRILLLLRKLQIL